MPRLCGAWAQAGCNEFQLVSFVDILEPRTEVCVLGVGRAPLESWGSPNPGNPPASLLGLLMKVWTPAMVHEWAEGIVQTGLAG